MAELPEDICPKCKKKMEKIFDVKYVCMNCSEVVSRRVTYVTPEQFEDLKKDSE